MYASIATLAFTTYSLGGLMREQVCTYMCPWPRIQGAMTDNEALAVTYRADRGEPRGPHRKGESWTGRGSCIDCNQCVAACPMGIDIRDGSQLECINCGLCIDACDDVMFRIGQPRSLIAYDTAANVERRMRGEKARFRFLRPRILLYTGVLVLVSVVMLLGLVERHSMGLDVLRDRNPDFVTLSDGAVRNGYTLKLMNHADRTRDFYLSVSGLPFRNVHVIGMESASMPFRVAVEADKVRALRVLLTVAKPELRAGSTPIEFEIHDGDGRETVEAHAVFVSTSAP